MPQDDGTTRKYTLGQVAVQVFQLTREESGSLKLLGSL